MADRGAVRCSFRRHARSSDVVRGGKYREGGARGTDRHETRAYFVGQEMRCALITAEYGSAAYLWQERSACPSRSPPLPWRSRRRSLATTLELTYSAPSGCASFLFSACRRAIWRVILVEIRLAAGVTEPLADPLSGRAHCKRKHLDSSSHSAINSAIPFALFAWRARAPRAAADHNATPCVTLS